MSRALNRSSVALDPRAEMPPLFDIVEMESHGEWSEVNPDAKIVVWAFHCYTRLDVMRYDSGVIHFEVLSKTMNHGSEYIP